MVVTIDKDQNVFLQGDRSPINVNDLPGNSGQRSGDPAKRIIYLRADEQVPFGAFASVMDAVKQRRHHQYQHRHPAARIEHEVSDGAHSHSTQLQPQPKPPANNLGGNFAGSLVLHAAVFGRSLGWALISHTGQQLGRSTTSTPEPFRPPWSSSLPLPPKQRNPDTGSSPRRQPSPAPVQEKEKTEAVAIARRNRHPNKPTKPVKTAEKNLEPPKHVQPVPAAQQSRHRRDRRHPHRQATMQLKNGTASIAVAGPHLRRPLRLLRQHRQSQGRRVLVHPAMLDPRASEGKRVYLIFDINRDGTPSNVRIGDRSGSPSLDTSAIRALQRVDRLRPAATGRPHHRRVLPSTTRPAVSKLQ